MQSTMLLNHPTPPSYISRSFQTLESSSSSPSSSTATLFLPHPPPIKISGFFGTRVSSWPRRNPSSRRASQHQVVKAVASPNSAVEPNSSVELPLTAENIETVLDEIRPYLISDGGNVALHEIDGNVVKLTLQGACGSCPSSVTTMKLGIERRLMEKIPEIVAVEAVPDEETGLELNEENIEKEMDTYPSLETDILGETTITGQSRRFQPKPKLQVYRERYDTIVPDSDVGESVSCQPDSHSVHSEMDFVGNVKEHGLPAADVLDFSARGFDNNIIIESADEFPVHEEYVAEASLSDAGIPAKHSESTSQMPEEPVSQRPKTKKQKFPTSELSAISEENGESRSLRSRRKSVNAYRLVDESDEDVIGDGEYVPKAPDDSVTNGNDEDFLVENDSQGKKVQKKSKKTVTEEGKRVRKSKKTVEASDQAAKKPKKFSHSTRQKRRTVDKALLEAPMDEIDYSKVPIKDLILLAEHKERLAKKDAAVSLPTTDQSAGASVSNYDEDETYASDDDGEAYDHKTTTAEDSSAYFNYQTYMDKTPSTRWSKQDTELFYEAVQQFGTDLSLIQQLFTGRTRRQLKLKYKKEERQNPFRLHDALTNRSKDHSHFERVIERLKQIEAEELQYADKDESIDLTGEEEMEGTQETNEEEAKSEHVEEKEVEAVEQDVPEMKSPVKEYDDEDDFMKWSQYTSEV